MLDSKQTIELFFRAFQKKDYKTIQHSYGKVATFSDPIFEKLKGDEIHAMWQMLLSSSNDLEISFEITQSSINRVSAIWTANYTFPATNRKVKNIIKSDFFIENQKIVSHIEKFSFYKWARQAFGLKGSILGWTHYFHKEVQNKAKKNLLRFMKKNKPKN